MLLARCGAEPDEPSEQVLEVPSRA